MKIILKGIFALIMILFSIYFLLIIYFKSDNELVGIWKYRGEVIEVDNEIQFEESKKNYFVIYHPNGNVYKIYPNYLRFSFAYFAPTFYPCFLFLDIKNNVSWSNHKSNFAILDRPVKFIYHDIYYDKKSNGFRRIQYSYKILENNELHHSHFYISTSCKPPYSIFDRII